MDYVYKILADEIINLGVSNVFGLMSDDIAALMSSLDKTRIRNFRVRHENYAVSMAEGYASASGKLGVAFVGYGPGVANGFHGAMYASRTGSPVLMICGDSPRLGIGATLKPDYKKLNTKELFESQGIQCFSPDCPEKAQEDLIMAAQAAMAGQFVVYALPIDFQGQKVKRKSFSYALEPHVECEVDLKNNEKNFQQAAQLIENSKYPIILAGNGVRLSRAEDSVINLANKTGALLCNTLKAKDIFKGHPYNLGLCGGFMKKLTRETMRQADCIIAIGAGLNFWTTEMGKAFGQAKIIQIDINNDNLNKWHKVDHAICSSAKQAAEKLSSMVSPLKDKPFHNKAMLDRISSYDRSQNFIQQDDQNKVDVRSLGVALDKILPKDKNLVFDVGNFCEIIAYMHVEQPDHFKMSGDFHSIGIGFGVALGYAAAHPDKLTVYVTGDGSFLMQLSELDTVVRENLNMIIIVANDSAYGAELHFLEGAGMPVEDSLFPNTDFAKIAKGFDIESHTITTIPQLELLADRLSTSSPLLIDCKISDKIMARFFKKFRGQE